jgi:hypothetical protein
MSVFARCAAVAATAVALFASDAAQATIYTYTGPDVVHDIYHLLPNGGFIGATVDLDCGGSCLAGGVFGASAFANVSMSVYGYILTADFNIANYAFANVVVDNMNYVLNSGSYMRLAPGGSVLEWAIEIEGGAIMMAYGEPDTRFLTTSGYPGGLPIFPESPWDHYLHLSPDTQLGSPGLGSWTYPQAVAEPETLSLLLAGLGILGFVARSRKQQTT